MPPRSPRSPRSPLLHQSAVHPVSHPPRPRALSDLTLPPHPSGISSLRSRRQARSRSRTQLDHLREAIWDQLASEAQPSTPQNPPASPPSLLDEPLPDAFLLSPKLWTTTTTAEHEHEHEHVYSQCRKDSLQSFTDYSFPPPPAASDYFNSQSASHSEASDPEDFGLHLSGIEATNSQPVQLQEMTTLDFAIPSFGQFGSFGHSAASSSLLMDQHSYSAAPQHPPLQAGAPSPYAPSFGSPLTDSRRRSSRGPEQLSPYSQTVQPSPYQPGQPPLRSSPQPMYSRSPADTLSAISPPPHSSAYPIPGQTLPGLGYSSYPPYEASRLAPSHYPPSSYEMGYNSSLPTYPPSAAPYPPPPPPYAPEAGLPPPNATDRSGRPGAAAARPKPQCWEHGCNGRQFSTFSNLLRHQREKSGTAAKSYCPRCGAEFTRTTARNGHMAHDKCKPRRASEASS